MTDEQVKKGLECCADNNLDCSKKRCPYFRECYSTIGNENQIFVDALALINRLEEENKKLSDNNKELRVLCHKKSNGMRLNDWIRMTQEAKVGIKVVDKQEEINRISKETAKDILQSFAQFRAISPKLSALWYELAQNYGIEEHKE